MVTSSEIQVEEAREISFGRKRTSDYTINLIGWILFVISAAGFIISSIRSGDAAALVGGIFFFVACLVFLVPFTR